MNALLSMIVVWLSMNFGLPAIHDHPGVEVVPASEISDARYGSVPKARRGDVVAVYDDERKTILLARGWSGESPADLSILVHEMVHHLQNASGLQYECPAARERLAYEAQARWLDLFGRNLHDEFQIDRFTLKLMTECFDY